MLEKLPIKKEYLLIAATIGLLLLSYRLAFKHTIEAWKIHNELQSKLTRSTDLSYQPEYLERKNANIDKSISQYKADTTEFRSNIINTISSIAEKENVKLTEVPVQDVSYRTDHFIIEKLGFEGDYFSLVRLAHDLQLTSNIGMIRSEQWKMTTINLSSKQIKKMVLEVYMEFSKEK
jgi:hypothetical protein